jgi:cysteine desulfurase family protein (TIGR01976 family)
MLMTELAAHVLALRRQFPALARALGGTPVIYLDGPAGTQTPLRVIEAIGDYLAHHNANHGGVFATSRESDELLHRAHQAAADLLGARDADCVAFGPNMTTLTFALSRALAQTWKAGDEIVVTRLDHDANVSPWVLAARDAGATVKFVELDRRTCTLDLEDARRKITSNTRLVAVGCASNATGGINPVQEICTWAREAGALSFLDAVHYAPHGLIDVQAWGCDFLACSAYKFFGPHIGLLWGRRELLETLPAYKVRPAPNDLPGKWMTGTQSHEGIAGTLAAIDYLADLGRAVTGKDLHDRRRALVAAFAAITAYERSLSSQMLQGLARLEPIQVWGPTSIADLTARVPTFSITHSSRSPEEICRHLDQHGIYAWHGNYYALELSETLGQEPQGMVRLGLVHYNTSEEIERLLSVLEQIC